MRMLCDRTADGDADSGVKVMVVIIGDGAWGWPWSELLGLRFDKDGRMAMLVVNVTCCVYECCLRLAMSLFSGTVIDVVAGHVTAGVVCCGVGCVGGGVIVGLCVGVVWCCCSWL